jgi:hypothetical protein
MEQTTFGSATGEQTDSTADSGTTQTGQPAGQQSSPGSTSSSDADSNITTHAPSGVEEWTAARDDETGYALLQVKARTKRTLQDTQGAIGYESRTHSPDDGWVTPGARFSGGSNGTTGVAEYVACWAAGVLATPHGPTARPFPAENVQVFAADIAVDLADESDTLQDVIATANTVEDPSLPSDDDFLELLDEYRRLEEQLARGGELRTRRSEVEQTMRAKIGWTSKYGHEVPDQVVAFSTWSLDDLNEELADLEDTIEQAEEQKREVRDSLRSLKHDRAERLYREKFASVVPGLQPADTVRAML